MKSASIFQMILASIFVIGTMLHSQCTQAEEGKTVSKLTTENLEVTVPVKMKYFVALPENYEKQKSCSLVLFLHGSGERGDDLEIVKTHGLPRLISEGKKFPFIMVAPQCPKGIWWQATELTALLNKIEKEYRVDKDRIYVTGLSMGGYGTWALAAYTPHRFAAIAPVCGGGVTNKIKQYPYTPVWAFHGDKDPAVPVKRSEEMVKEVNRLGGTAKLTIYPNVGHLCWKETYENPKLYEWLLSHKRQIKTMNKKEKK